MFAYLKLVLESKNWVEVTRVRGILIKLIEEDSYGFIVRSKFRNNATNESASLFHANLEMKNGKKNSLSELKIEDEVTSDSEKIEEEIVNYFHALFNGHHNASLVNTGEPFVPDNTGLGSYLTGLGSLPDSAKSEIEEDITMEELEGQFPI